MNETKFVLGQEQLTIITIEHIITRGFNNLNPQ